MDFRFDIEAHSSMKEMELPPLIPLLHIRSLVKSGHLSIMIETILNAEGEGVLLYHLFLRQSYHSMKQFFRGIAVQKLRLFCRNTNRTPL